ncbi:O-antigen/teichoic acid export membrane protein [Methanococcus voltae PS]|uniref:O-antigen/teichoic acid export membrane protein n=2 Tax=Methanococcus voltae PS TaxID=523842 RepID=A0ABT2EXY5_METVO|nr:flippase [Methanococcus voltae]MCS3921793.1 O-antigen/teichoic acid export membrane protein [Methanococcus voltae PS]
MKITKNQYSKNKLKRLKQIKNSEDNLFKDSFYMILSNLYSKLILYLFFWLIPFIVGTEGFGIIRGLLPIADTIVIFFCSGIPPAMAKFISENKSKTQLEKIQQEKLNKTDFTNLNDANNENNLWEFDILKYMVLFSFVGALFAISLKYILGGDYSTLPDIYYYAIALSIPFSAIISWSRGILQGNLKIRQLSLTWVLEHTSKVIFLIPLALFFGVTGALLSISVGYLLGGLLGLYIIFKYIPRYKNKKSEIISTSDLKLNNEISNTLVRKVMIYALPIALTATSYRLLNDLDSIFIMSMLGGYDNGLYGYASLISKLLFLFAASISTVLIPRIAKSNSENLNENNSKDSKILKGSKALNYLKKSILLNFIILLPLLTIFVIFANDILKLSFGVSNIDVSNSLIILSFSASVMSMYTLSASSLQGIGYAKIPLYIIILGIVLNSILNLSLIPIYGIMGGAMATLISSSIISIITFIIALKKLR